MNFDNKIISLIKSLYEDQKSAVQLENGTTDWFPVTKGVRGCILSPHLLSLYTEGIMREVENMMIQECRVFFYKRLEICR